MYVDMYACITLGVCVSPCVICGKTDVCLSGDISPSLYLSACLYPRDIRSCTEFHASIETHYIHMYV